MPEHPHGPAASDYTMSLAERGAQLERLSREIDREQRWDTARTLLTCGAWSVASAIAMGWSFSSTDAVWAPVIFWGAMTAGNAGIWIALIGAYRRHLERTGEG